MLSVGSEFQLYPISAARVPVIRPPQPMSTLLFYCNTLFRFVFHGVPEISSSTFEQILLGKSHQKSILMTFCLANSQWHASNE